MRPIGTVDGVHQDDVSGFEGNLLLQNARRVLAGIELDVQRNASKEGIVNAEPVVSLPRPIE